MTQVCQFRALHTARSW